MRELTYFEGALVSGGNANYRDELREAVIDTSLICAPLIGAEIGLTYAGAASLNYALMSYVGGAFVGIVAIPVLTKVGLELMFGMHDILV